VIADCVGLDIGQTAFKAVRFRRRLTGRESVEYFHHPLPFGRPGEADPARRAAMLRNFLWKHGLYGSGDIVTALPCQDFFIRTLSFPFHDSTKLAQVVPFEVENLIPLPLEEVAMGSMVLPQRESAEGGTKAKGSDVLVTAAPREKITEHLRFLAAAELNPAAINVDGMALFSVAQFLKSEGAPVPGDLAIIDVGASKTTLCLIRESRPVVLRTVLWGGNHLTHALAVRYACSFADAERRKRAMAVQEVDAWLEPLLKELRVTLHPYDGTGRHGISHCWVSGGGSKLRELSGHVAHNLGLVPVGPRQGFGATCPRAFSVAFGLALHPKIVRPRWKSRSSDAGLAVDLKEASALGQQSAGAAKQDRRLAMWGALVIGLLALMDLSVRFMLKDSSLTQLKQSLQMQYEQTFGPGAAPGEELDQARYRLTQVEKGLSVVEGSRITTLSVLAELGRLIPLGVPLKIRELTIDGGMVHLEGETVSFDAVEKLKQIFVTAAHTQDVAVTDTRVGAVPNQVVFRLNYSVKGP
jgi:general secretion pathway protein L